MTKWLVLGIVAVLVSACGPRQVEGPTPFQPAGVYEFTTVVAGDRVTGTIEIDGQPGAYGAAVTSTMAPGAARARSVAVDRQTITIHVSMDSPMGYMPVVIRFEVDGRQLTGEWSAGGEWGSFTGVRRG
jgi:hypothetical protein